MLLHDWVKISMFTAKFQVGAHYTYCDQLILLKMLYIKKYGWLIF